MQSSCVALALKFNSTKCESLTKGLHKSPLAYQSTAFKNKKKRYKMHYISRLLYQSIMQHIAVQVIGWYMPEVIIRTETVV